VPDERGERTDFRKDVTDKIVEMLEKGTAPWQKPWDPEKATLEMPFNPTTDKAYRGGNAVHLLAASVARGYEDPRWMTYRQAQENGWQVRKGEKGTSIEFWQFPSPKDRDSKEVPSADADDKTNGSAPLHRLYTVFNATQIDGVEKWQAKVRPEWEVVQNGENILAGAGARIAHDQQDRAFYSKGTDQIHLPSKSAFPSPAAYYGTALHELGHWTGHSDRLNRDTLMKSDGFGGPEYAKEELRAELTSLFLAAERGIPHDPEQHAAYVGSWVQVLKEDKNEIFRAAKDASKATEFLLERERKLELEPDAKEQQVGQHKGPDGQPLPDVIERETSEHVAVFDTNNGAVQIVEKNTATETRELFEPVQSTAPDATASGKTAQEQILDGVVDGRAAPTEMPKTERTEASLSAAKSLIDEKLGGGARAFNAQPESGRYEGPIIGATTDHLVQQITPRGAVIHERAGLNGLTVDPERSVLINYSHQLATVTELQPKNLVRELAELER